MQRFFMKILFLLTLFFTLSTCPSDQKVKEVDNEPSDEMIHFINALTEDNYDEIEKVITTKQKDPLDHASGVTPPMIVAAIGQLPYVIRCIEKDYNLDIQDVYGNTALHYATMNGQLIAAKMLLCAGADHTIENKAGKTALAASINHEMVTYFHAVLSALNIHNPNEYDKNGWTPLLNAIFIEDSILTTELIKNGSKCTLGTLEEKITPLMLATKACNPHLISILLSDAACLATLDEKDIDGNTALHHAVFDENTLAIKQLIIAGASTKIRNNKNKTALEKIKTEPVLAMFESACAVKKALSCSPKDLDDYDTQGMTALFHAIRLHDLNLVKELIASGADPRMTTQRDRLTPEKFARAVYCDHIAHYFASRI